VFEFELDSFLLQELRSKTETKRMKKRLNGIIYNSLKSVGLPNWFTKNSVNFKYNKTILKKRTILSETVLFVFLVLILLSILKNLSFIMNTLK